MTTDGGTLVFFFSVFKCWCFFFDLYIARVFSINRWLDDGGKHYFSKLSIVMVEWHS